MWQYRLFASKNILMFAYGFAVPIDWETHQLLSKTELSSYVYVQWRAAPSGSFYNRRITKDRSPQILYSRSFVVLFVQQNFFSITEFVSANSVFFL